MDINAIWQVIEPWVTVILAAVSAVVSVCITVKARLQKWNISFLERYDINDMASKVATQLSGKTLNLDVTAIAEKKMDKIEQTLNKKVMAISELLSRQSYALAKIGVAMARFKSLTDEERQGLQDAIKALDSNYTPSEPEEIITVKLEPISTESIKSDNADEQDSIINFGALSK